MARPEKLVKRITEIKFRVTPLEKKIIQLIANKVGLTVSDFVRKSAMNKTIHRKFTDEEIKAYKDLHTFYHNFGRISNLIKASKEVRPELLTEIRETQILIYIHLKKFSR